MKKYMYLALKQIIIIPMMFPLNSDDSYFNYADSVWSKNNDIVNDALKKSIPLLSHCFNSIDILELRKSPA